MREWRVRRHGANSPTGTTSHRDIVLPRSQPLDGRRSVGKVIAFDRDLYPQISDGHFRPLADTSTKTTHGDVDDRCILLDLRFDEMNSRGVWRCPGATARRSNCSRAVSPPDARQATQVSVRHWRADRRHQSCSRRVGVLSSRRDSLARTPQGPNRGSSNSEDALMQACGPA